MEDMNLKNEIKRYSVNNGYPISDCMAISCVCGSSEFHLYSDDDEGGAYIICADCGKEQDLENSKKYIEEKVNNICTCDNDRLMIGIGKAYYSDSKDPRWVYVGAKCNKCGLAGVYADWKEN